MREIPMIDFQRFCQDFYISTAPRSHKHARRNWLNVSCPFHRGNPGYHLGYNLEKGYFFCWSCGWHPEGQTLELLSSSRKGQRSLLSAYSLKSPISQEVDREVQVGYVDEVKWPEGYGQMVAAHRNYLFKRGFDPEQLERDWKLGGTRYWGPYAFRIIAPIHFRGQIVSWQSRDITDHQRAKYLPCPKEREVLPHKHVLYGFDKARWRTCVVVEGITGVWRLGPGSVATFGVEYTPSQLLLLSNSFDRVLIFNDGDEAGQRMAERMALDLQAMNKDTEILEPIGCDSGNVPDELAEKIMSEVRV